MLVVALVWLYTYSLRSLPARFRAEYGEEMAAVFGELLAAQAEHGTLPVLREAGREFGSLPLVLWRVHRREGRGQKAGWPAQWAASLSPFQPVPRTQDGRHSWNQALLECSLLFVVGGLLLALTYARPAWIPAAWEGRLGDGSAWVSLLALPLCLLGFQRGLPRWSYAPTGLLLGHVLFTAAAQGVLILWFSALLAAYVLLLAAVYVHVHGQPLAPALQRLGRSLTLDWTRASFAFYALLPYVLIAAFDNTAANERTPWFGLAVLALGLGALAYCRSRSQRGALAALVAGTAAVILLAAIEQSTLPIRQGSATMAWLGALGSGMLALLLLPAPGSMLCRMWCAERSPEAER